MKQHSFFAIAAALCLSVSAMTAPVSAASAYDPAIQAQSPCQLPGFLRTRMNEILGTTDYYAWCQMPFNLSEKAPRYSASFYLPDHCYLLSGEWQEDGSIQLILYTKMANAAVTVFSKELMLEELTALTDFWGGSTKVWTDMETGEPLPDKNGDYIHFLMSPTKTQENIGFWGWEMLPEVLALKNCTVNPYVVYQFVDYDITLPFYAPDAQDAALLESHDAICFTLRLGSGDLNQDGAADISDAVLLARLAVNDTSLQLSDEALTNADLNGDGKRDDLDLTMLLRKLAKLD